jgi:hypothetical protein
MTISNFSEAELAWGLPAGLSRLRPEACGLLTALNERVWRSGDPVVLELVRVRVGQRCARTHHCRICQTLRLADSRAAGVDELASLGLDITKWSTQKIKVALGTDGADRLVTDVDGAALFGSDSGGQATGYRRR